MPLTFHVDGKIKQDPSPEDITAGFASIDAEGVRSISIVAFHRPPVTLCAFGHPKEGYTLDVREDVDPKGTETSKVTSLANLIPHAEIVGIFQDFAKGDDSWQSKYHWEPGIGITPTARIIKRLIFIFAFFGLLFLILKYVLKLV